MAAAARAASVASETAMPQSAFFKAGASFTPSAGHAHNMAAFLQNVYDMKLMLGKDLGKTIGFLNRLGRCRRLFLLESPKPLASRIFVPISNFLAVSLAIAKASPVTI